MFSRAFTNADLCGPKLALLSKNAKRQSRFYSVVPKECTDDDIGSLGMTETLAMVIELPAIESSVVCLAVSHSCQWPGCLPPKCLDRQTAQRCWVLARRLNRLPFTARREVRCVTERRRKKVSKGRRISNVGWCVAEGLRHKQRQAHKDPCDHLHAPSRRWIPRNSTAMMPSMV